jgi:hypothetical protein
MSTVTEAPRISNLRVYVGDPDYYMQLPSTSTRYRILQACTHLAICLLESTEGRKSLALVASAVIQARSGPPTLTGFLDNQSHSIDHFLSTVRNDFPPLFISERVEGEAETERFAWGHVMSQYQPSSAARIFVHKTIIDNMLYAREQVQQAGDAYDIFKFQMSITLAHEVVHLLTGFLLGYSINSLTPPNVTLGNWGDRDSGEAGRY